MKAKLLNVFTVCLITLLILSPEIAVFGLVWQQHLHLTKTNLLVQETNLYKYQNEAHQNTIFQKSFLQRHEQNSSLLLIANKYKIIFILELLLICIPVGIGVSVFAYDKYLNYREQVYRKQVEILERIWLYK